jgi:hypothetical protein
MSRILWWAGPALLMTALVAQQDPPTSPPPAPSGTATAAERFAALQADVKKLNADYQAKVKEARAKAEAAKASGEKVLPAMPMRPDFAPLVEQADAAAKDFAGTDDAVQFLVFVVQNAGMKRDQAAAAMATLVDKHVDHAAVAKLAPMLPYLSQMVGEENAPPLLDKLGKSANADVRGWVAFARHGKAIENEDLGGTAYKTAKMELQKAAELASDKRLQQQIGDAIEIREKFAVGNVAPDIEGTDLDGVAFKLSDYKGKVVFLDFWGNW